MAGKCQQDIKRKESLRNIPLQYGKLGRYIRTSSSAK